MKSTRGSQLSVSIASHMILAFQYRELPAALAWCASSDQVHVAVVTGSRASKPDEFFSSGNDLMNLVETADEGGDPLQRAREACLEVERMVNAFVDFPKVLIAAVNGPAHGIAVTTILLCDFLYTNEKATFTTPFTKLAQNPEGCSSLMFPLIMGQKANRMLLLGETITAQE
jgi:peroxisomal 3,2-trans-enoyl-CoA isomerase